MCQPASRSAKADRHHAIGSARRLPSSYALTCSLARQGPGHRPRVPRPIQPSRLGYIDDVEFLVRPDGGDGQARAALLTNPRVDLTRGGASETDSRNVAGSLPGSARPGRPAPFDRSRSSQTVPAREEHALSPEARASPGPRSRTCPAVPKRGKGHAKAPERGTLRRDAARL